MKRKKFETFLFFILSLSFFVIISLIFINLYLYLKKDTYSTINKKYEGVIDEFSFDLDRLASSVKNISKEVAKIINSNISDEKKRETINTITSSIKEIRRVMVLNKDGTVINTYPFNDDFIGLDLSEQEFLKKSSKALFLGPHICEVEREVFYVINEKYPNFQLAFYLDMNYLKPYLDRLINRGLYVFAVDEKGKVMVHVKKEIAEQELNLIDLPAVKKALISEKGLFDEYIDGDRFLLYANKNPALGWTIFVGEKYAEATRVIRYIENLCLIAYLISISISFLSAKFISKRFNTPIRMLLDEIEQIKKGHYSSTAFKENFHEISLIHRNLISMSEEIKKREYMFRKLFEETRVPIYFVKQKGDFIDVNNAFLELFGFSNKHELKNYNMYDLYKIREDRDKILEEIEKAGYVKDLEVEFKKKTGETIIALLTATKFQYLHEENIDKSPNYMGIIVDITERKALMEQLIKAQKMEISGRLAGGIAHDFNNLLSIISGSIQLIEMKITEKENVQKYIDAIKNAVFRGRDFIKGFLAFTRKQVVNLSVYDLNNVINEEMKILSTSIREDIRVEIKLYERPLPVKIDRGHFTQILLNLVINAMDAMPKGGSLKIETNLKTIDKYYVKFNPFAKEGVFALLSLTDTGEGMTKDVLEKIFDPFFTTKEHGTGLGLSVTFALINQFGGFINAYSEKGKGTTFKIYLPIATEEEKLVEKLYSEKIDFKGKTVMVVDDEKDLVEIISDMLKSMGFYVFSTTDTDEAIEIFRNNKDSIDLCISDIVMPKVGGLNLYESLISLKPDLKIIFITGYAENIDSVSAISNREIQILQKPFSKEEFLDKIKKLLT